MSDWIEGHIAAATRHAEDSGEPGHEVGDLQGMLRLAWRLMAPAERAAFLADPEVIEAHASALGEDPDDAPRPDGMEALLDSARQHGEASEPDMEPGDLQVHLRAAFQHMTEEARASFASSPESVAVMDAGGPAPAP